MRLVGVVLVLGPTRPFVLDPGTLPAPSGSLVGAAAVRELPAGWRRFMQG